MFQPFVINFLTYSGLSLICIPFAFKTTINLSNTILLCALAGGLCGAAGNNYLIKALKYGDLSILGPVNAYKSVVAMFFGIFLLKELPSLAGLIAVGLIIWGSYFVFDASEYGFSWKLLKQKSIRFRIYALVLTAIEAVFIKNVVAHTNVSVGFYLWCWFGALFSFINVILHGENFIPKISVNTVKKVGAIIICTGLMQYCTNFVFARMNVSYALALFQLSAILSVIFGWKYFRETRIKKKMLGTVIMVFGAAILILLK